LVLFSSTKLLTFLAIGTYFIFFSFIGGGLIFSDFYYFFGFGMGYIILLFVFGIGATFIYAGISHLIIRISG